MEPVPALVTLHLWRVERAGVPRALLRMGRDRTRVRRTPGPALRQAARHRRRPHLHRPRRRPAPLGPAGDLDLAGGGAGLRAPLPRRAPPGSAWPSRPGGPTCVRSPPAAPGAGGSPFGDPVPERSDGPVAALTRARLRPAAAAGFWRAVPPVSADLRDRPGLRAAVGIGEAPLGLQGTFSLWESGAAVREFARGQAHAEVVARTEPERWYAEELFARFDVVGSTGTLDGRDPLA